MLYAHERRHYVALAAELLSLSPTWSGWVRVVNTKDHDGKPRSYVCFARDDEDEEIWVTPEAFDQLAETVKPRLF